MDKRDEELLREIKQERHIAAMMTLANIKYIRENCMKNRDCENCNFLEIYKGCIFQGAPECWDEYEITERMYR